MVISEPFEDVVGAESLMFHDLADDVKEFRVVPSR